MQEKQKTSCFARMLDVRGFVIAARRSLAGADAGGAFFLVVAFGLISLALFPVWVSFDLLSTWDFTTGLRNASEGVIYDAAAMADGLVQMSVGAFITGLIFTAFTLLPSLFELAFPSVAHPLLNLLLLCSIVFDYVTDWGKAAEVAGTWTDNPLLAFAYTAVFCAFVSVGVQALLAISITVVICGVIQIFRSGRGAASGDARIIEH